VTLDSFCVLPYAVRGVNSPQKRESSASHPVLAGANAWTFVFGWVLSMFGKHTTVLITWNKLVGGLRGHALRFRCCFDHLETRL
jgi:hypothetical protein